MVIVCLTFDKILLYINKTSLCFPEQRLWYYTYRPCLALEEGFNQKKFENGTLLKIRDIKFLKFKSDKFVFISLYFPSIDMINYSVYAYIY